MLKFALLTSVALIPFNVQATEWKKLATREDYTLYFQKGDPEDIGDTVLEFTALVDFKSLPVFSSLQEHILIDCKEGHRFVTSETWFSGHMGSGKIMGINEKPRMVNSDHSWEAIIEDFPFDNCGG